MLRITDARTGEPTDATPARRGLTRVQAHVPRPDTTGLRVLLIADVLVRALEISGTPVWTVLTGVEGRAELRTRAAALGIRPFEDERDSGSGLGEAQVLHVLALEGHAPDGVREGAVPDGVRDGDAPDGVREGVVPDGIRGGVAPDGVRDGDVPDGVRGGVVPDGVRGGVVPDGVRDGDVPDGVRGGVVPDGVRGGDVPDGVRVAVAPVEGDVGAADPTTLRLALLARPRREPLRLDEACLADAEENLTRWRGAVATWATRPSGPIPDPVRQQLRAAWEDDLDVPAVLGVLRRVETSGTVPDGARFETYAYADRLLGLELTRDIGRGTPS